MTAGKYFAFFAIIILIVAACLTHAYWGPLLLGLRAPGHAGPPTSPVSDSEISVLNICITLVLFVLLAFSILNIYSFFNAQIHRERRALTREHEQLRKWIEELDSRCTAALTEENYNHIYEKNLARLLSPVCPVHVRTAAAGFFHTDKPRDNDRTVLESLFRELPSSPDSKTAPLRDELQGVLARWRSPGVPESRQTK